MDWLISQNPTNYSIYSFSPAIFDYPFDYLIYWYTKQDLFEKPQDNQKLMYLIIRESSTDQYLKSGWYGDKTKDRTQILERQEFPGDLVIEKHLRND